MYQQGQVNAGSRLRTATMMQSLLVATKITKGGHTIGHHLTDSKNRLERENCRVYVRHTKNFFDALRTSPRIIFDTLASSHNSTLISIKSRRPHLLSHHPKLSVATASQRSSIVIFGVWGLKGLPQTPILKKSNRIF